MVGMHDNAFATKKFTRNTAQQALYCAGRNQRKSKASTARSFAVQDLLLLTLAGLIRISEPYGVRVAELSSI
jgi:hypothetical protein